MLCLWSSFHSRIFHYTFRGTLTSLPITGLAKAQTLNGPQNDPEHFPLVYPWLSVFGWNIWSRRESDSK